jgi:plastocyanin
MRRATLLVLLGLGLLGAPAAAQHAAGHAGAAAAEVSIGFDRVTPLRVDVVTGETVMWTNDSVRVHTATADDASYDSGRLSTTDTFSHTFTAAGEVPYHCSLHPVIRGVVAVHDLLLNAPPTAASTGRSFVLSGRAGSAVAPQTPVSLQADAGAGFAPVATTVVGPDGTFSATFTPTATATYRAVAGAVTSPSIDLLVLDRRIGLTTQRARGRTVLRANVAPASRGGHVVLQLFLPERFGWWPVQRARLDGSSSARFSVRTRRRLQARVVLTLPDGATRLAVSRTVHVGRARQRSSSAASAPVRGATARRPPLVARRTSRGATTRAAAASQYTRGT